MKALADQVRGYVKNASDEAVVAFGVSAGIVGVMAGGATVAADAPPGGGRRPAPKRKAAPVTRDRRPSATSASEVVFCDIKDNGRTGVAGILKRTGLKRSAVGAALRVLKAAARIDQSGTSRRDQTYSVKA